MQRYRIGVLMGGSSSEVQISLQSGQAVYEHLDPSCFDPYRTHILSNGCYVWTTKAVRTKWIETTFPAA